MKNLLFITAVSALAVLTSPSRAATIITANSPGANGQPATNVNLPATFGDNISLPAPGNAVFTTSAGATGVVGTSNIDLTWSATGGTNANAWQSHAWTNAGGGALQLDGSSIGSIFSITLTPNSAAAAVVVSDFNFIGDTNGDSYQYRVDLVNLLTGLPVFTANTPLWTTNTTLPNNGAPFLTVNSTGNAGVAYRLDFVRTGGAGGSSAVNIAIDNLRLDQVPEPHIAAFLLGGICVVLGQRRRPMR